MNGTGAAASYGDLLMTSLLVLVGVAVAAFVIVKLVGRFLATGGARGAHVLDVVARVPLEPRRSLYVVEVAGKTLLVGTSEMGLNVLSELDGAEVRARVVPRQSFAELVRAAWGRRRGLGPHADEAPAAGAAPAVAVSGSSAAAAASGSAVASGSVVASGSALVAGSAPASASASASGSALASSVERVTRDE